MARSSRSLEDLRFLLAPGSSLGGARPVATWRAVATKLGLTGNELERMSSAFEHEDLKAAVRIGKKAK